MSPDKEFEFQLHELRYDLAALLCKSLELVPLITAENAHELQSALSNLCSEVEHDYVWHSSRALDLARRSAPLPEACARRPDEEANRDSDERWSRADELTPEGRSAEELLRELHPEITELSASLHEAAAGVARVEALRCRPAADAEQVETLLERVHASITDAVRLAFSAMRLATWLDRVMDPERWQAEQAERAG